jgi:predicted aspartyl protease
MAFEFKITATFAPGDLAKFGPLIPGRVALPTSRNPKDGIEGFFLIDTGASNFSIDQSVANELGLTSSRTVHKPRPWWGS